MTVLLLDRRTSCNYLQRYQSSAPAYLTDPSCHIYCSTITLLICQGELPRSRGFVTLTTSQSGLGTKDPTARVQGKLTFDLCAEVNNYTLHTDTHQFHTHPDITLEDTQLPLERSHKILGVPIDPSLSFHKYCNYVTYRIAKRNNMLKALAGSSWGQEKILYC